MVALVLKVLNSSFLSTYKKKQGESSEVLYLLNMFNHYTDEGNVTPQETTCSNDGAMKNKCSYPYFLFKSGWLSPLIKLSTNSNPLRFLKS